MPKTSKKSKKSSKSSKSQSKSSKTAQSTKSQAKSIQKNVELENQLIERTKQALANIKLELEGGGILPSDEDGFTRVEKSRQSSHQKSKKLTKSVVKSESNNGTLTSNNFASLFLSSADESQSSDESDPEPAAPSAHEMAMKTLRPQKISFSEHTTCSSTNTDKMIADLEQKMFPTIGKNSNSNNIGRPNLKVNIDTNPNKFSSGSLFDRMKASQPLLAQPATVENDEQPKFDKPKTDHLIKPPHPWRISPKQHVKSKILKKDDSKSIKINNSDFQPSQIKQFKTAFDLLDVDKDGIINFSDLRTSCQDILNIPNQELTSQSLNNMVHDALVPINFSIFLNILGERLYGADPEDTILEAFRVFDPEKTGKIDKKYLSEILQMQADRFTEEELEEMYKIVENDSEDGEENGVDYENLVYTLCYGESSPT